MWYEILPTLAIIAAGVGLPPYVISSLHELIYGNPYRRTLVTGYERRMFRRDIRLTDNPFFAGAAGLENIPDE